MSCVLVHCRGLAWANDVLESLGLGLSTGVIRMGFVDEGLYIGELVFFAYQLFERTNLEAL